VGSGADPTWSNPSYGITDNSSYASQDIAPSSAEVTYYLKATGTNPVPSPPGGYETTIDGIKLFIKGYSDEAGISGAASTYSVRLVSGGTIVGDDLGTGGAVTIAEGSSDGLYSLGGSTEKWGLSNAQLLAVNGLVVSFQCSELKTAYLYINHLWLEITYTETLVDNGDYWIQTKKRSSFMMFMEDD
jgi:hypothetical protein